MSKSEANWSRFRSATTPLLARTSPFDVIGNMSFHLHAPPHTSSYCNRSGLMNMKGGRRKATGGKPRLDLEPFQTRFMRPIDAAESPVRHHSLDSDDSSQSHTLCRMCTRNCRSQPVRRQTMTTHTARRHSSSRALPQDSFDHNWSMNRWSSSKSQHSRSFSSCTR